MFVHLGASARYGECDKSSVFMNTNGCVSVELPDVPGGHNKDEH